MTRIAIHDASLRDGQHAIRHQLSANAMAAYAAAIDVTGVAVIEVGHGNGLAASSLTIGKSAMTDLQMLRAVRPNIRNARLGVFFVPGWARIEDLDMAINEGAELVRIAAHCTEANVTFRYLEHAAKAGIEAQGVLLMSHMATTAQLVSAARSMIEAGASAAGIFDSSGHYLPDDVRTRVGAMAEALSAPVIFHGHENLGLGVANSLAAAQAGAGIIDACALGFGAGAGNSRIELVVPVLEKAGFETGIGLYPLFNAIQVAAEHLIDRPPYADEISIVSGLAGVFSGFKHKVLDIARIHDTDPREVFFELGRRKVVAGQEDMIEPIAIELKMSLEQKKTARSDLARVIAEQRKSVLAKRDAVIASRAERGVQPMLDYAWATLERRLADAVRKATGIKDVTVQLDQIARAKFGGDIALKVPSLLKVGGPKRFTAEFQPAICDVLRSNELASLIERIEVKGMYINITLTNDWLLRTAEQVVALGERFGLNDSLEGKSVIVDYSSPNVAKVLHAGHIRSTITGEVLANIYDACGATVFRLNHINDFGGFGFLLEGYRRFFAAMPEGHSQNDRLLELYTIRRTLERCAAADGAHDWAPDERETLARYFPEVHDIKSARAAFEAFTRASDDRFERLENGDPEEIALWQQMVEWSLRDFDKFYKLLNIDIDFVIGESFYFQDGLDVVRYAVADGRAEVFTTERAQAELAAIDEGLAAGELSEGEAEFRKQGVNKDIGSTIVRLPSGERFVLLRSDGRSIYATRDVGAIARRNELFAPDLVVYVVGQEQRSHFERLFASAEVLGLVENGTPELTHLYFGFYVDQATGRKLSSRDSVSNVMALLDLAERYFLSRLSERDGLEDAQRARAARELTVGSLVFNDLKQDIKGSVEIDVSSLENTVQGFERSGGAYTVYTACRARSILRRHGLPTLPVDEIGDFELSDQEVKLLMMLQLVPSRVAEAARTANPTHLLRHLLEIAMEYNSYYTAAPVLTESGADEGRLLITKAVQLVLVNGLAICHIDTPESI